MAERGDDGTAYPGSEVLKKNYSAYMDFVARYYGDPEFRARADQDPTAAAKAAGMDIPEGAQVKLWFNADDRTHIVIPARRA